MGVWDFFKANRPVFGAGHASLLRLKKFLSSRDITRIKHSYNLGRVSFSSSSLGVSAHIGNDCSFPSLSPKTTDEKTRLFAEEMNLKIETAVKEAMFQDFAKKAEEIIPKYLAFKLHGLGNVKNAITLQMFANERIHVLLLGDPGTGKTEFLQSVEMLHPRTTFGLGSGTSGVGLAVTVKGKEIKPGLLPNANKGICCIDELNLMKREDYASLYSAMEKGFITYDKGGSHNRFDADVRILATANPIGDKFRGGTKDAIVRQLPFEPALLSRFTLIFLIRRPDLRTFTKIAEDIVDKRHMRLNPADVEFIREYILFAEKIEVEFPRAFKNLVVDFSSSVKEREDSLFFEVSPRLIHGLINLSKASARLNLRKVVEPRDIQKARELLVGSLENKIN
jgi:replicative DNA helicase Mcm